MNYRESYPKEYNIWKGMRKRCNSKNSVDYQYYGGKGVKVSEEWARFKPFLQWYRSELQTVRQSDRNVTANYQIDRIDNDGPYSPSNCRLVTAKVNSNNRGGCRYIEYAGKRQTVTQWADETGITRNAIASRIKRGWTVEEALTRKLDKRVKFKEEKRHIEDIWALYEIDGRKKTIPEWCKELGISTGTVYYRIKNGWPIIKAITTKPTPRQRYYEVNGVRKTVPEYAEQFSISRKTLYKRIKHEGSPEAGISYYLNKNPKSK